MPCKCFAEGNSSLKPVLIALLVAEVSEGRPAMPPVQVFAEGMGRLLEAISVTSSIIKALQQHFAKVVAPHMEDAPAEGAICASGLAALVHAVEDRVLACLQGGLNALSGQVSRAGLCEWTCREELLPASCACGLHRSWQRSACSPAATGAGHAVGNRVVACLRGGFLSAKGRRRCLSAWA